MLPRLWPGGHFSSIDAATLSYLRDKLGVDFVWYTGVIDHATTWSCPQVKPSNPQIVKGDAGSPYAIRNYFDVAPYLASDVSHRMEEFEDLVRRTHEAGLKVIIDFIPNHVSRDYCGTLGRGDDKNVHWAPGNDFFYYPGEALALPVPNDGEPFYENPAKASGNAFTPRPSVTDWYETVKLNYCPFHTPTWDKMLGALRFWASKGVDGFRCDMVELVPYEFLQWAIGRMKAEFPGIIFIAEVYEKEKYGLYSNTVGFDYLYDKSGLYDTLRAVCCENKTARSISWNWQFLGELQGRMLNFLENHDEQRIASDFFLGSAEAGYAALGVSLLMNSAPFMLYFGEEVGERGMDDEPFSGVNGRTSIFDWWKVGSLHRLREWIDDKRKGLTRSERAVLKRYTEALELSRRPVFREGEFYDLCYMQEEGFDMDRHYAFLRRNASECWLVAANFSSTDASITVRTPDEGTHTQMVPAMDFVAERIR